jgi:hypothetical protein
MTIKVEDILQVNDQKRIMVVNNNANQNILLLGSCRITPFLNYMLNHYMFGNNYNYLCVMVHNHQMKVLSEDVINNEEIKHQICRCKYLLSEYMVNYNLFNTSRSSDKNIFKIYDSFEKEIILPNWSNICLYAKDLVQFKDLKNEFNRALCNEIHINDFAQKLRETHEKELERYYNILRKANFPELIDYVKSIVTTYRIANTLNHPSNLLFIQLYRLVIEKYFTGGTYHFPESVLSANSEEFLQNKDDDTKLTFYDYHYLGIRIPENYLDEQESINRQQYWYPSWREDP